MAKQLVTLAACACLISAVAFSLAGCSGSSGPGPAIIVPSAFQGTWVGAAQDNIGQLKSVSLFSIDGQGQVHVNSSTVIANGNVNAAGHLTLGGTSGATTFTGAGTLQNDDTGSGNWTSAKNGTQTGSGTILIWRANGSAYAGTWDVTVNGGATGAGVATVDGSGVISGSILSGSDTFTLIGVVTGTGRVVVAWGNANAVFFGTSPANGTASGSQASGSWQSDIGISGTWTATKR